MLSTKTLDFFEIICYISYSGGLEIGNERNKNLISNNI
jgi:hypothetical protein